MARRTQINNNFSIWLSFTCLLMMALIFFMTASFQMQGIRKLLESGVVYEHVVTGTTNGIACRGEVWRNGIMVLTYDECECYEDSMTYGNVVMVDDRDYEGDGFKVVNEYTTIGYLCPDSTGYVYKYEPLEQ